MKNLILIPVIIVAVFFGIYAFQFLTPAPHGIEVTIIKQLDPQKVDVVGTGSMPDLWPKVDPVVVVGQADTEDVAWADLS